MTAAKRAGKAKPSASTRETASAKAATATTTTGGTTTTGAEDDGDGADGGGDDAGDAGDAGEGGESREEDEQIGVDAGDERVRGAFVPRDAVVVRNILREMGVTDVEHKVISQGMEFMHRYASEVLEESTAAARHANRTTITADDVKIGAKSILMRQFLEPPSLTDAHAMASAVNKRPLQKLSHRPGIHVPTEINLLNDNWDIGPPRARDASEIELEKQAEAVAQAQAAAAAARDAIARAAVEPGDVPAAGARDAVSFDVKTADANAAADATAREDLGDFAEFMDLDDDDDDE